MTFATTLFASLALLVPETGEGMHSESVVVPVEVAVFRQGLTVPMALQTGPSKPDYWYERLQNLRDQKQNQVQIEQRMTIRIIPQPSPRVNVLTALPDGEVERHLVEKKMSKCVPVSGIAGVQVSGPSDLILFLRDRRMVNAALERSCRARDFYSGFYLQRSVDGKLCVDRDTLLSRSGANCKLTRFRQLVPVDD